MAKTRTHQPDAGRCPVHGKPRAHHRSDAPGRSNHRAQDLSRHQPFAGAHHPHACDPFTRTGGRYLDRPEHRPDRGPGIAVEQGAPVRVGGLKCPGPVREAGQAVLPRRQVWVIGAVPRGAGRRCVAATVGVKKGIDDGRPDTQDFAPRARDRSFGNRGKRGCLDPVGLVDLTVGGVTQIKTLGGMAPTMGECVAAGNHRLHLIYTRGGRGRLPGRRHLRQRRTQDVTFERDRDHAPCGADAQRSDGLWTNRPGQRGTSGTTRAAQDDHRHHGDNDGHSGDSGFVNRHFIVFYCGRSPRSGSIREYDIGRCTCS